MPENTFYFFIQRHQTFSVLLDILLKTSTIMYNIIYMQGLAEIPLLVNILNSMKMLGHLNIKTASIYTQIVTFESDEYNS
ncbi:hypothetical protein MUO98_01980 [Candidatus Bathyarchaeota archaeon]|nr:hypothetical protein [Candidatus Bathyarchaeota archaeon]